MISTSEKIKLLKNRIQKLTFQIKDREIQIEECKRELERLGGFKI